MRIAIFGVGGVGGYFGWRLAQTDANVVFLARGEGFRAMSLNGLKMDTPDGKSVTQAVQVSEDPKKVGPVDAVILGVKAWQVPEAANAIQPLVGPNTFVVPLQNGLEAPSHLSKVLGPEHVFGGLCRIVAMKVAPGHIRHVGLEPYVAFGELDNRPTERGKNLQKAFLDAGVKCEIPLDIHIAMWEKFLFICSLSGVAAATRAPAGVIRSIPETRRLLEETIKEIIRVAHARNVLLKEELIASTMTFVDNLGFDSTASMQRDIMEGRPSELSEQLGTVERLGQEVGVQTPLISALYASLLPQELRARGKFSF
ncbi:MAG: ketopantoate reductase family protein [Desulfomonilaceae bacterium]